MGESHVFRQSTKRIHRQEDIDTEAERRRRSTCDHPYTVRNPYLRLDMQQLFLVRVRLDDAVYVQ